MSVPYYMVIAKKSCKIIRDLRNNPDPGKIIKIRS